jgi:prepilin-type N-terminal cleavage/methylation domain-containing protein
MRRAEGFTLIELLVVIAILATLAGLTTVLISKGNEKRDQLQCTDQVRKLASLIESAQTTRYPQQGGANLILYLVTTGDVAGKDALEMLFCPGDLEESLRQAGGPEAYRELDPSRRGEHGHLTSYAGRDLLDPACRARKGRVPAVVLLADDSEDHHGGKGIVVGLTGGAAVWRDKVDDYELRKDVALTVGEASEIEELRCLRVD